MMRILVLSVLLVSGSYAEDAEAANRLKVDTPATYSGAASSQSSFNSQSGSSSSASSQNQVYSQKPAARPIGASGSASSSQSYNSQSGSSSSSSQNQAYAQKPGNQNIGSSYGAPGSFVPQNPQVWDALRILRGGKDFMVEDIQEILAMAVPGQDFPINAYVPEGAWKCDKPGFFADDSATSRCQVFHRCDTEGFLTSYLCPNRTLFNQITLTCDWFFNVDCSKAAQFADYSNSRLLLDNAPLLDDQMVYDVIYPSYGAEAGAPQAGSNVRPAQPAYAAPSNQYTRPGQAVNTQSRPIQAGSQYQQQRTTRAQQYRPPTTKAPAQGQQYEASQNEQSMDSASNQQYAQDANQGNMNQDQQSEQGDQFGQAGASQQQQYRPQTVAPTRPSPAVQQQYRPNLTPNRPSPAVQQQNAGRRPSGSSSSSQSQQYEQNASSEQQSVEGEQNGELAQDQSAESSNNQQYQGVQAQGQMNVNTQLQLPQPARPTPPRGNANNQQYARPSVNDGKQGATAA